MDNENTPFLDLFKMDETTPDIKPGQPRRKWMDETSERFAYRCLPLTMANSTGWDILCPFTVDIEWTGGQGKEDIIITSPDPDAYIEGFAQSHFMHGIVTFHTGYLFRTPPGWATWVMGPPNWPKDGIAPLSGLVETDWLPFPFTMNWKMTRRGKVRFEKGEPFCFFTLSEHRRLDDITPKIRKLSSDPELEADCKAWHKSRQDFIKRLDAREDGAVKAGWQRHYMRAHPPGGEKPDLDHNTKRRLKNPGIDVA